MKTLSQTLLSLMMLVIIISSCSSCKKDPITPTPPTTYIVSFNANGGTGTVASSSAVTAGTSIILPAATNLSYTNYTFVSWNTAANGTGTSYAAGASFNVTGNVTLYATWSSIYTAVFTAVDASGTVLLKSLPGNSVAKAIVLNVTTPGFVKLETIGTLANSNPAIGYWWITSKDSSEVFQATSTLNPSFVRIAASASQNINLSAGVHVICFKTAPYSGAITNGTAIGLKVTGANSNVVSNASYTADATSANVANVVKIYLKQVGGVKASANLQTTGFAGGDMQVIPYNDEAGTVYDANLYPSINFLSFDTKNTLWISSTTGYSGLDFTNALGSAKQDLGFSQSGSIISIFQNSDATLSGGILQFSKPSGTKLIKSNLGNFAYTSVSANVYNPTATQFGPASFCWYLKSIRFAGNPELWIYDPSGARIW